MRSLFVTLMAVSATFAVAGSNETAFTEFDDQYNAGYSYSQYELKNGGAQAALQQNQGLNLEIERLFDLGIWMNITANLAIGTNSLGNMSTGTGMGPAQPATQVPNLGGVNSRFGYAFVLIPDTLQLTPYALGGYNTNMAMSTITANNFANVSSDVYFTGGVGTRLEYRINKLVDLYAAEEIVYNWDQSGPLNGVMPQNNMIYTTTVGAKYKPYKALILGLTGFYSNYQYMASAPGSGSTNGGNSPSGSTYTVYQPQNSLGAMVTVGLTY